MYICDGNAWAPTTGATESQAGIILYTGTAWPDRPNSARPYLFIGGPGDDPPNDGDLRNGDMWISEEGLSLVAWEGITHKPEYIGAGDTEAEARDAIGAAAASDILPSGAAGRAVLAGADIPSIQNILADTLTPQMFGAIGNGVADDTAAIAAALAACASTKQNLTIPAGTYKLTSPVTWDASLHSVVGQGYVLLDFSSLTSGPAVNVIGAGGIVHGPYQFHMRGLCISGPDSDDTTVDGLSITTAGTGGHADDGLLFERVKMYGFRDQVVAGSQSWAITWNACLFGHFHRYGCNITQGSNSGQGWVFNECTWSGGSNAGGDATGIYTSGNVEVFLFGCTNGENQIEISHNGGVMNLHGCHIENRVAAKAFITLAGGSSIRTHLAMFGGQFGGIGDKANLIEVRADSPSDKVWVDLNGVAVNSYDRSCTVFRNLYASPVHFRQRGGYVDMGTSDGTKMATMGHDSSLLYNGDFEQSTSWAQPGWRTSGSYTTKAINTTLPHDGTHSLEVVGVGTTGDDLVWQYFPVIPGKEITVQYWYNVTAYTAGSLTPRIAFYQWDQALPQTSTGPGSVGVTRTSVANIGNIAAFTAATSGWVPHYATYTVPRGVSFGYIDFYFTNWNGTAYVDDVIVTEF